MIGKYSGLQSSSYMFDWLSSKCHQNMTNQVYIHLQEQSNERLTRLNPYFNIQLFRERLSEKERATIPKGILSSFERHCTSKKFERMARDVCDVMFASAKGKQQK